MDRHTDCEHNTNNMGLENYYLSFSNIHSFVLIPPQKILARDRHHHNKIFFVESSHKKTIFPKKGSSSFDFDYKKKQQPIFVYRQCHADPDTTVKVITTTRQVVPIHPVEHPIIVSIFDLTQLSGNHEHNFFFVANI